MNKDSFLYKNMAKYRLKYLAINIVLSILFVMYTVISLPYLKASFGGPKKLDTETFLKETDCITIDAPIELGRKDHKLPDMSLAKENTYWQGDVYDFVIDIPSATPIGEPFTSKNDNTGANMEMYRVHMTEMGGRKIAVLAYPNTKIERKMQANLSQMQKPIASVISKTLKDGEEITLSEYVIDLRNAEMGAESSDILFFWLLVILMLFLWVKLILYYINPKLTPTFRQLIKYGDIVEVAQKVDLETKSEDAYKDGDMLVLENFVITKSTFKTVVAKNHMAKH